MQFSEWIRKNGRNAGCGRKLSPRTVVAKGYAMPIPDHDVGITLPRGGGMRSIFFCATNNHVLVPVKKNV